MASKKRKATKRRKPSTKSTRPNAATQPSEQRLETLIQLSCDVYWEQDEHYRFTFLQGPDSGRVEFNPSRFLGKTRWEVAGSQAANDSAWQKHKATLEAHRPFTNFIYNYFHPQAGTRYFGVSGQPMFDGKKKFLGYRGISRDCTTRIQTELWLKACYEVPQLLAGADTVDQAAPKILQLICRVVGYACGVRWTLSPSGVFECADSWSDGTAAVDKFIAAKKQGPRSKTSSPDMLCATWDRGEPVVIPDVTQEKNFIHAEAARAAGLRGAFSFPIKTDAGVVGVFQFFGYTVQQPSAELISGCTFIANLINQFLHRYQSEQQLRASEALARSLADIAADWYWEHDAEGRVTYLSPSIRDAIGVDPKVVIGKTRAELRGTKPLNCTWEEYNATIDAHQPYRELEYRRTNDQGEHIYYTVSGVPVFDAHGRFQGYRGVGRNITGRRRAEHANQRLGRMFATLSATNETIIHAESPEELYQQVCAAAVDKGGFALAAVLLVDAAGRVTIASASGAAAEHMGQLIESVDDTRPEGRGLIGTAFRTQRPCVSNDVLSDERTQFWRAKAEKLNVAAAAALPLVRDGRSIGVLFFYHEEQGAFDEEIVKLLGRMSANVSFALDNFDREAERQRADAALRESEARFRDLTALSSDWYWEQDEELRFTFISLGTFEQSHHGSASSIGKTRWELPNVNPESGTWEEHRALLAERRPFRDFIVSRLNEDGKVVYISISGAPIFDEAGRFTGYRGVGRDITESRVAAERIEYLASHDGLTGLPNRVMFSEVLNLAIETGRRYQRKFAVLFLDLDRFKFINDSLGHEAGDALLKEMSTRLKGCLRSSDVVARLGGDEFVVLLQEVKESNDAAAAARKILSAAIKPMQILGHECRVTASIGICLYPADAEDEQALMKNADLAMYQAKEEGKNNFQFYSKEAKTASLEKLTLEFNLRRALENKEFSLNYQAKRDLKSGAITGVEALLRWQNPELGSVSPAQFIPIAEETGLIVSIGRWVLFTACAQNMAWQQAGLPPICMSVNLSPRQFADPDLVSDVTATLANTGMAGEHLELEITESMVMHNTEKAVQILGAIKQLGVKLSIDDFGTGYSSLAQLKRFPIDTLKVDRSFIRDIPNDSEDKAITEAIIAMGKTLSLTVIAEGVETQEQEDFLRKHACDQMQGYFFSKPTTPDKFAELLGSHLPKPEPTS